ncbi:hypothetical protein QQ045_013030 [Rhodiola kirilowii]
MFINIACSFVMMLSYALNLFGYVGTRVDGCRVLELYYVRCSCSAYNDLLPGNTLFKTNNDMVQWSGYLDHFHDLKSLVPKAFLGRWSPAHPKRERCIPEKTKTCQSKWRSTQSTDQMN